MSRFTKMRKRTPAPKQVPAVKRLGLPLLAAAALGAGFLAVVAPAARAGGAVYQQHTVNAGVLVDGDNSQGSGPSYDPAPYLFYVLNNRADVRPPDLTLVNPLAPTTVTSAILNRWTPNIANPKSPYSLGQIVTPDMAPYWEVPLNSVSDNELAEYNVLYLRADNITFGPAINEKLRRFVDNGGQLIIEYGVASGPARGLFTGTGAVLSTPTGLALPTVTSPAASVSQPLVSQPYFLTIADATSLFNTISSSPLSLTANGSDSLHGSEFNTMFSPALVEQSGPLANPTLIGSALSTAQIGAGQVIVSALRIGTTVSPVNNSPNPPTTVEPSNVAYYLPQVNPQTTSPTMPPTVPRTPVASDFYNVPAANPNLSTPIPAADLKLLANAIEGLEAHPSENKTSHGNASNAGLASFSPAWQFPVTGATASAPGAAVWGNFVFATDAVGTLHAFDAFPSENLTGTADTNGKEQVSSISAPYYPTTSYDEIWNQSLGAGASAPTVASFGGVNYVFVELPNGSVAVFNTVTGKPAPFVSQTAPYTLTAPAPLTQYSAAPYPVSGIVANAPSPTFYEGRLYAGQANGTLVVYDLSEGSSAVVPLNSSTSSSTNLPEPVTGPAAVGTLTDGDTNVIVAVVSTPYNVYSVIAGARNEPLKQYLVNNALTGYNINRLGRYDLNNIFADVSATAPPLRAYDYGGNVQGVSANSTAPNPQDPLFSITGTLGYYTDWNMDFASAVGFGGVNAAQVNLNYISASPFAEMFKGSLTQAISLSPPAIDRHGDFYYTETAQSALGTGSVNSYLTGVSPAPLHNNVHLKFRFRMPNSTDATTYADSGNSWNYIDAEGVNYNGASSLVDFRFVGSPVVDDQGNVYALAVKAASAAAGGAGASNTATVLCFRANQQVTALPFPAPANNSPATPIDLSQATITQKDEGGGEDNTIQRGPDDPTRPSFGQFIAAPPPVGSTNYSASTMTFYNFGKRGRTGQEIAGNVSEPQPLTATDTTGNSTTTTLGFRTNLAWFLTPFPVSGSVAGLSLVGSSLFLSDGMTLYRVPTKPQIGANKTVTAAPFKTPIGVGTTGIGSPGLGTLGAPPSIGGNVMVLNGTTGIAALTRQVTVIADNNRILGVDGDGGAVWGIDATTRTDPNTGFATKVPLSHPTALSQFALNDYLVADTGSNRCVRFDSAGNVQWELTRFGDPSGLMAPGQPLTLSQPSSVVVRPPVLDTTMITDQNGKLVLANPGGSFVYYLVADSGHNRIVEVEDRVTAAGSIYVDPANPVNPLPSNPTINHQLTWVTHTGDRDGRNYRYGSADYYTGSILVNSVLTPTLFIAATVVNTRLAPMAVGGGLGPVSADAPGGSLVVFQHPPNPASFSTAPVPPSDLVYAAAGFYTATVNGGNTTYTPFVIRNPRFLKLYTPVASSTAPNANVAPFDFLYADDNGAFDLTFNTTGGSGPKGFVAAADRLQYKAVDYQNMNYVGTTNPVSAFGVAGTISRLNLPFIPTCVQALSTDSQNSPGAVAIATTTTRRYLITQSYSQGELGGPPTLPAGAFGKIGGEIFEIDVSATGSSTTLTNALSVPVGGFGGQTLSHPDLTGPLTQPTYAVRLP